MKKIIDYILSVLVIIFFIIGLIPYAIGRVLLWIPIGLSYLIFDEDNVPTWVEHLDHRIYRLHDKFLNINQQLMKIRLAKKIMKAHSYMMKQAMAYDALWDIPYLGYWADRWMKYRGWCMQENCVRYWNKDHRITKAIRLTRKKKQLMTEEDFKKTRWWAGCQYHLETDKFEISFSQTCNCSPPLTMIVHRKVTDGKVSYRSGGVRYVCNGIYYKSEKDLLERCNEKFTFLEGSYND